MELRLLPTACCRCIIDILCAANRWNDAGVVFLGENITPLFIIGGILIGTGLVISSTEQS
jgi:drug/metabolite transporter (DMT)-like permease